MYSMSLICFLDDSNIIFQKLLEKLNAIGINHSLTKNIYKKNPDENIDNNNNRNKPNIIHDFEKQYYLNLQQMNSKSKNKNNFEVLDDEEGSNSNEKNQQKAYYLEFNPMVFFDLKI